MTVCFKPNETSDEQLNELFDQLGKSFDDLEERVEDVRGCKDSMFNEITAAIQQDVHVDNIEAYERNFCLVRESYISKLRQNMRALFDRLESDLEAYFQLKAMISRNRLASLIRLPESSIRGYVELRAVKFIERIEPKVTGDFYGSLKWKADFSSFQCLKWYIYGIFTRDSSFLPMESFSFAGKAVRVRYDSAQMGRHLKHFYLFDLLDKDNNVRTSVPFQLTYDISNDTTTIYSYGSRLLLVTDFAEIRSQLVFYSLKRLDTNNELPNVKPVGQYNASYFALFDTDFKLVKEFVTGECLKVGRYSTIVDFINERGVMMSKIFESVRVPGTSDFIASQKRLVSFYNYDLRQIIRDLELPDSERISNVVKIDGNLIYYAGLAGDRRLSLTIFDLADGSVVSSRVIPRKRNRLNTPKKILLDSQNNLYLVTTSYFPTDRGYFLASVNVDTHEWHEIDPPYDSAFYHGCYLNENDQLVIVSMYNPNYELTFNTFGF